MKTIVIILTAVAFVMFFCTSENTNDQMLITSSAMALLYVASKLYDKCPDKEEEDRV